MQNVNIPPRFKKPESQGKKKKPVTVTVIAWTSINSDVGNCHSAGTVMVSNGEEYKWTLQGDWNVGNTQSPLRSKNAGSEWSHPKGEALWVTPNKATEPVVPKLFADHISPQPLWELEMEPIYSPSSFFSPLPFTCSFYFILLVLVCRSLWRADTCMYYSLYSSFLFPPPSSSGSLITFLNFFCNFLF